MYLGKTRGKHVDISLFTPYEIYKKETQSPEKVYRKRLFFNIAIVAFVILITAVVFVPKYGSKAMFLGIIIACFWGRAGYCSKNKIIKKQNKLIQSWENKPIPVEDKNEKVFKMTQRFIVNFIYFVFLGLVIIVNYFPIEDVWFCIPLCLLIIFLIFGIVYLRAYYHHEVHWVSYTIDYGSLHVTDEEGKDLSEFYDVYYENEFMPMSPEERVRAPHGYTVKKHLCKSCKNNISKLAQFCPVCGTQQ